MKPKPIALIHAPFSEKDIDVVTDQLHEAGYLPLIIYSEQTSIRILRPNGMKRADYALCRRAAETMLKR